MRVVILGSGASSGTPSIESGWGACDPAEPRNLRTRPSILVEKNNTRILVDTSPDLRQQLLMAHVPSLSAVVFTHAHADHMHGIDDLRGVNRAMQAPLDVYADAGTIAQMRKRFDYALQPKPEKGGYYRPVLIPTEIRDGSRFNIEDVAVIAFEQDHGFSTTLGFRFDDVAYTTDVVELPPQALKLLDGVRLWIIGTLTDRPHTTHCTVSKALTWIERIKPQRAVLSHLGNELDYATLRARLPSHVSPAFDGMEIEIADEVQAVTIEEPAAA